MSKTNGPSHGPIVVPMKDGGFALDFKAALAAYDLEVRQSMEASADLARLGYMEPSVPPPETATPRAMIHPPVMPDMTEHAGPASPANVDGMGDIHTQTTHPGERYYEMWETGRARRTQKPIGKRYEQPRTCPPKVKLPAELESWRTMIDQCLVPLWQRLQDEFLAKMYETLKCVTVFTQPTTWLAPPATALGVDLFTPAVGVAIPGVQAHPTTVLSIPEVPDRTFVILQSTGLEMEPGGFGKVRLSYQRNRTGIGSYTDVDVQLGPFSNPTPFGSPIILKHKDTFRLQAISKDGAPHTVYARIKGWLCAARTATSGGDFSEFHTM